MGVWRLRLPLLLRELRCLEGVQGSQGLCHGVEAGLLFVPHHLHSEMGGGVPGETRQVNVDTQMQSSLAIDPLVQNRLLNQQRHLLRALPVPPQRTSLARARVKQIDKCMVTPRHTHP